LMYMDGSTEMKSINQEVIDSQTGKVVKVNDLSQGTYDVICKAGPSFRNRQEQTLKTMLDLAQVDPTILQLGGDLLLKNVVSPVADALAERRRIQMIAQGVIPESQMTDEEKAQIAQRQAMQGQAQDPAMVLAQAESMKAQAEQLRAQVELQKLQLETAKIQLEAQKMAAGLQSDQANLQLDAFNAETNRMNTQIKAQEAGAKIQRDQVATQGQALDNQLKVVSALNPFVRR